VTASETIAVLVPKGFFNPGGGVVTLLDASGLKVAGATYPSASEAELVGTRSKRSSIRISSGLSRTKHALSLPAFMRIDGIEPVSRAGLRPGHRCRGSRTSG
jgi:hypothetical protein